MTDPTGRRNRLGMVRPVGPDSFALQTWRNAIDGKALMGDPLRSARMGILDTVRPPLMSWLVQTAAMDAHQSAVEALTAPMRRAVQDLARLYTPPTPRLPSDLWSPQRLVGVDIATPWSTIMGPYARAGLLDLTKTMPTLPTSRVEALSHELAEVNAEAFRSVSTARAAELLSDDLDIAELERGLRTDPNLGAAVDEVVDSEPVAELLDYLEELQDLEVDGLSEEQTTQLRQDLVTRLITGLAGRLDSLPITLTPNIITTMFAALHSLVVATTLEIHGQGELVGQVADTVAWPLGVLGVAGFVLAIKVAPTNDQGENHR